MCIYLYIYAYITPIHEHIDAYTVRISHIYVYIHNIANPMCIISSLDRSASALQRGDFRKAFCVFNVQETVDSLGGTGIDIDGLVPGPKFLQSFQRYVLLWRMCMCMCIYIYTYIYIHIIHTRTYVCICIYIYVCVCVGFDIWSDSICLYYLWIGRIVWICIVM